MSQIALPLEPASHADGEGYIVTPANLYAHQQLSDWTNWPHGTAILIGPAASGKSSMAAQFVEASSGHVLEDADTICDDDIFHLWNRIQHDKKPLLLTSSKPVSRWNIILPDLQSRLASSLLIEIPVPDQEMIEGLFQKYFSIRGLAVSGDALSYLGKRMDRSYLDIQNLAQKMDALAIERQKSITLPIARESYEQYTAQTNEQGNKNAVEKR